MWVRDGEQEDPNLDVEESRASGDKVGASPEGPRNRSDLSIAQNEEGTGSGGGNSITSTESASTISDAGSGVDFEGSSGTKVTKYQSGGH